MRGETVGLQILKSGDRPGRSGTQSGSGRVFRVSVLSGFQYKYSFGYI